MPKLIVALALLGTAAPAAAECAYRDAWARALEEHTRAVPDLAGVRVDYAGLGGSALWPEVVAALGSCRPEELAGRAERLAFWIDAYNILAIDVVVKHYPVESIRDVGSLLRPVWKREAGRIGGRGYSLDEIEHGILRPLGEPRIHGAIVCASLSCPSLRREPFRPDALDAQLDDQMRVWLADERKGARRDGDTLWLSRIFKWFGEDFEAAGGGAAFAARYRPELAGAGRVRHLDYDWSLNDLARAPPTGR